MKVLNQPKSIKPSCSERERSPWSDHLLPLHILEKISLGMLDLGELDNGIRSG